MKKHQFTDDELEHHNRLMFLFGFAFGAVFGGGLLYEIILPLLPR